MSDQETLKACQDVIREKRYSRHPFVAAVKDRPPSKERLAAWAVQKYHQVYMQNRVFSAIHANSPHEDVRQWMVEQLVAEETPLTSGSDSHYNLMRRFAEACGAPAERFREGAADPPVRAYVDTLLTVCREEHFVLGLLAIYAIEAQSGESVARLLRWLRETYDFSERELEWFTVHSAEEDDHAGAGLGLVVKYAHLVDDFETVAPKIVNRICDAWLVLHDYYFSLMTRGASQVH